MKNSYTKKILAGISSLLIASSAVPVTMFSTAAADSAAYGDANCDGKVNLADAVLIMQYKANPTKYGVGAELGITEKGLENADVCDRGDGVTTKDALSIQKYLLGTINELPESWSAVEPPVTSETLIHLKGTSIEVEGEYAEVNGTTVTISHSGTFVIDGTLDDGQIHVNIPDEAADPETVKIFLSGVSITGKSAPAIYIENAENTSINIVDGTQNTISDGDTAYAGDWIAAAVIEAKDDITFKGGDLGTGVLTITANTQDAVVCNNDIKFTGGTINIDALNGVDETTGVNGKTSVTVKDTAVLNIDAEGDGLKSSKGDVAIEGGTISVKAGNDAVQAGTTIDISGGTLTAGGDRGLTAATGLNITGGKVAATATDNQVDTTLMTGTTQGTLILNCIDDSANSDGCWKKANSFGGFEFTKKYKYVLLSSPDYTTGKEMMFSNAVNASAVQHSGNSFKFTVSGVVNTFNEVNPSAAVPPSVNDTPSTADGYSITLSGSSISTNAPETVASADSGKLTISQPAAFAVSGNAKDVQILVDVDKTAYPDGVVELELTGADISNSSTSPIYVKSIGDEVQIIAKGGTVNIISDGTVHTESYTNSDGETVTVEGAVFSKDDLKFKGSGTLTVNGNVTDGIVCKNDLKIYNGNITVNAADDGIRGKDSVTVGNAADTDFSSLKLTVNTTQGDGIKSTGTDASTADKVYGNVTINGGTLDINSHADGIQGEQSVVINGGDLDIFTYEGSGFSGTVSGNTGGWGGSTSTSSPDVSAKGIKAVGLYDSAGTTWQSVGDITVNGGNITVDSSDDAIHCGGDMKLLGGTMKLATADDGVHSDHNVTIGQGSANSYDDVTIIVSKGYEGIEGLNIVQNSGTVICNTTDDGYNAAGGADGSGNNNNGGWRPGNMQTGGGNYSLEIKGGFALVNVADGDHDGFDSNGSLTISGGFAVTNGSEAFDCDGTKSCTGGIWVENTGSGGMGGGFGGMGGGSLTASVSATGSASKGTRISLVGSNNQVIVSFIAGKSVSNFKAGGSGASGSFYTGGTLSGSTYFQTIDDTQSAAYGGTLSGGTKLG